MADVPADLDSETLDFAHRMFDLARTGDQTLPDYLDAGLPVNLTNDKGDCLLMLAAYHGHPAAVQALLERGADPDRVNDRGQTPLAGAVFHNRAEIVTLLRRAGADPTLGSPSALETARFFERGDLVALLAT